jgi:hypothetical protein
MNQPYDECDARGRRLSLLGSQDDADNQAEERNTLNKGSCNNHRRTDIASSFRLTGRAFHGWACKLANAETGTESNETSTKTCTEKCESSGFHVVSCYRFG